MLFRSVQIIGALAHFWRQLRHFGNAARVVGNGTESVNGQLGLVLFFVLIPIILFASVAGSSAPVTPANTVLSLDLREPLTDVPANTPFAAFSGSSSITGLVRKLEAAETDSHVKGLFIRASEGGMAPAHAEEIRQALIDFKASGKFVIAHAQGFEDRKSVV